MQLSNMRLISVFLACSMLILVLSAGFVPARNSSQSLSASVKQNPEFPAAGLTQFLIEEKSGERDSLLITGWYLISQTDLQITSPSGLLGVLLSGIAVVALHPIPLYIFYRHLLR